MTNFNINQYLDTNHQDKNEHLGELCTALTKVNDVRYIRRFCFANYIGENGEGSKTLSSVVDDIRAANLIGMLTEACLHPSIVVEITDKQLDKLNRIMEFFIRNIEDNVVMKEYMFSQIDQYNVIEFIAFEYEMAFSDGKPSVNFSIVKPCFAGNQVKQVEGKYIDLGELDTIQVIDYAEFELF